MRLNRLLVAAVSLVVVGAGCDLAQIAPPGAGPLRYRDAIFSSVVKTSDVTYGTATNLELQNVTLKLDVYQPPASDSVSARPAIVWVHGGSFSGGDKTSPELVDESNTFAKQGFVNFSINYRLEPGGCSASNATASCVLAIQEATQDAQTAVRFVRTHASTYGVDPDRIAIGGSSAGAITALQVGYASSENPASKVRAASVAVGREPAQRSHRRGRPGAAVPRHGRPARSLPVGGQHGERGDRRGPRRVARDLAGCGSRSVRAVPHPDPHPVGELPLVDHGSHPRRDLSGARGDRPAEFERDASASRIFPNVVGCILEQSAAFCDWLFTLCVRAGRVSLRDRRGNVGGSCGASARRQLF